MKKILIISPAWIGDAIMADSLYQHLKVKYPGCQIDVLGPQSVTALHARMPSVDHAIALPIGHGKLALSHRYTLGKSLQSHRYDRAYVLPNSFKSALIPWFARIPIRIGWQGELRFGLLNDRRTLDKAAYPLMVQRFVALGHEKDGDWDKMTYPLPILKANKIQAWDIVEKLGFSKESKSIIAICPGAAYGPAKRWPARHFAEVAKQLVSQGKQVWLFGSADDQKACDEIDKLTDHQCLNLGGKTSLVEMIDLLSLADYVITNDTGPMHVAAALERPLIAIFGSSNPYFTPPLSNKVNILSLDSLSCKPCFKRECPLGHMKCLNDITPAQVLQCLESFGAVM